MIPTMTQMQNLTVRPEKAERDLGEYGLHCMGIAENGFRELSNSKHEVKTVDDMKNLKVRVAGSNLLMECYKRWGQMPQT